MEKKSPDAFRTISEVAEWLGVPTHVLRFWESRFAQVKPVKRAGGRRYYRPADMELLGGIRKLLHDDGITIRGVQKLLREEGVKHVAAMSPPLDKGPVVDMAPSNVVELRKPAAEQEASPDPTSQPTPDTPTEPSTTAEDKLAATPPGTADEQPADTPPHAEPSPGAEAPAVPAQPGFDFGAHTAPASQDLSRDEVLESSDAVEFHSHGAGFTAPPASGDTPHQTGAEDAAVPSSDLAETPRATPAEGEADTADAEGPVAAASPKATDMPPPGQPDPGTVTNRVSEIVADTVADAVADLASDAVREQAEQQSAPPEEDSVQTREDPDSPDEAEIAPSPPPSAAVDISHIPADPDEGDISPAGPSLAARMRRLATRSPQGSPAQMRALGDRLQELSGRMKREAPRRGMQ